MTGISDACDREASWLQTSGDSLPVLLAAAGGRWGVVQAYWPGIRLATQKRGIYVTFGKITDQRVNSSRVRPQYVFRLKLTWPVLKGTTQIAEGEQAAFAAALQDLVGRIRGPFHDKGHGGRFLSVGEVPRGAGWPVILPEDPEKTLPARYLGAAVTYSADDFETTG